MGRKLINLGGNINIRIKRKDIGEYLKNLPSGGKTELVNKLLEEYYDNILFEDKGDRK